MPQSRRRSLLPRPKLCLKNRKTPKKPKKSKLRPKKSLLPFRKKKPFPKRNRISPCRRRSPSSRVPNSRVPSSRVPSSRARNSRALSSPGSEPKSPGVKWQGRKLRGITGAQATDLQGMMTGKAAATIELPVPTAPDSRAPSREPKTGRIAGIIPTVRRAIRI